MLDVISKAEDAAHQRILVTRERVTVTASRTGAAGTGITAAR